MKINLNLKTREKIMLAAAAAVVLYFLVDFLLVRPMGKEMRAGQAKLKEVEEKMAAAVNLLPELKSIRSRLEEKKRFLESAKNKVVGQDQIKAFLDQLAAETGRLKLEIQILTIGQESELADGKSGKAGPPAEKKEEGGKAQKFKKVVANLNLTGAYESVREYLFRVERLPLFMELDQVQIQGNKDGLPKVQLTIRPGFLMKAEEKL
jgi:Tfp pilus assembly protein PilO